MISINENEEYEENLSFDKLLRDKRNNMKISLKIKKENGQENMF